MKDDLRELLSSAAFFLRTVPYRLRYRQHMDRWRAIDQLFPHATTKARIRLFLVHNGPTSRRDLVEFISRTSHRSKKTILRQMYDMILRRELTEQDGRISLTANLPKMVLMEQKYYPYVWKVGVGLGLGLTAIIDGAIFLNAPLIGFGLAFTIFVALVLLSDYLMITPY